MVEEVEWTLAGGLSIDGDISMQRFARTSSRNTRWVSSTTFLNLTALFNLRSHGAHIK